MLGYGKLLVFAMSNSKLRYFYKKFSYCFFIHEPAKVTLCPIESIKHEYHTHANADATAQMPSFYTLTFDDAMKAKPKKFDFRMSFRLVFCERSVPSRSGRLYYLNLLADLPFKNNFIKYKNNVFRHQRIMSSMAHKYKATWLYLLRVLSTLRPTLKRHTQKRLHCNVKC